MRSYLRCPKCDHRVILKAPLLDSTGNSYRQATAAIVAEKKFGGLMVDVRPVGVIDAYVCRNCGYMELYVAEPSAIPENADGVTVLRSD